MNRPYPNYPNCDSAAHSKWRRGFTLIEILVALAVVVLLSAILLSVFARLKSRTNRALCASNLFQIGLADQMYMSDTGHYPGGNPGGAWADRLLPYVHKPEIFECPSSVNCDYVPGTHSVDGDMAIGVPVNEYGAIETYWGGYDLNWFVDSLLRPYYFTHPASTIFVLDGDGDLTTPAQHDLSVPDVFSGTLKEPRHQGGSNCLFVDGHVKWVGREQLRDRNLWAYAALPPLRQP